MVRGGCGYDGDGVPGVGREGLATRALDPYDFVVVLAEVVNTLPGN